MKNLIRTNALQILNERTQEYNREGEEKLTIQEYHEHAKDNDPAYYNWLFNMAENLGDYGQGMTEEQEQALKEFEETLN